MPTIRAVSGEDQLGRDYLIHFDESELLGGEKYPMLVIAAAQKLVDELVKEFKPEISGQFRKQLPKLVKEMGNEVVVRGLKAIAAEKDEK